MPFYEYQCAHCGHHVEVLQKVGDAPLKKCPACGRAKLARLVSRVAFRLKGGGWYETDFKSEGENKRNLVGDEPAPAADKPADKPTETPAAPAEAGAAKRTEAAPAADKPAKSAKSTKTAKPAARSSERGRAKPAARPAARPAKAAARAKPKRR